MDAVVTAALGAVPQLGGAGLLVFLIVLLIRREGTALERERTAHDAEIAEKDREIVALRQRRRELDEELDRERERRRAAEDALPRAAQGGPSPWAG